MNTLEQLIGVVTMSNYRTLPVSPEFRDELRKAKAKTGESYEEFIKRNLDVDLDEYVRRDE